MPDQTTPTTPHPYAALTNDPILLAALCGIEEDPPISKNRRGSSQYRGVSKNRNAKSTTWSASISWGDKRTGKEYSLGTYSTEVEAALARNYADNLLNRPKPVRNAIAQPLMPDETTQKRVAATVISLLQGKGALPPTPIDVLWLIC